MTKRVMKMIMMMIDVNDDYSHHWFSLEIKSEERAQKFHSDDVHYADLGNISDWLCRVGIWP